MKRFSKFLTATAACALLGASATTAFADYTLSILHINDLHSRIEPINRFDSTCSKEDNAEGKCFGGIARVKTKIDQRRAALERVNRPVLVLDAGDQFQGSLFYTTYKGSAAVGFLNDMGIDAMAVGNHEFDDGPDKLAEFIDAAKFPVISGNTIVDGEPLLKGKIPGYIVVEKGGEKIGIISVLAEDTAETSSPGPNVKFLNTIDYLKSVMAQIEAQGVNKVIALTHVGLEQDKAIAAAVDGIDVIVGGHSHTLLSNSDPKAAAPYPVRVKNPSGVDVPIVQAYAYSKYVGELRVTFDDAGVVKFSTGNTHLLDASVAEDELFKAKVEGLALPIEELKKKQVGSTSGAIDGDRNSCRLGECQMGNLVADAMLDRVKDQGVSIAIQNGGGLRASIDAGEITMGEVFAVLPFQNTLATFQLKGSDVVAALENGVSQVEEVKGRFPQVAGLRFSWDKSQPAGNGRIKQVQVMENGEWTDIDPNKVYGVVTNNYMRGGGDGYKVFATNGMSAYDYGPGLEEVVANYLGNKVPYQPYTDGRILEGAMFSPAAVPMTSEIKAEDAPKAEMKKEAETTAATTEQPKAPAPNVSEYVVKRGDNLWNISRKVYGDATQWKRIQEANGVEAIRNMKIGTKLRIPN